MSEQMMFDFAALAGPMPDWATACMYCVADDNGQYDEAQHLRAHLPMRCAVCGDTSPNLLLFGMSHTMSLGATWREGFLLCTSLWLRLNHLTYALMRGERPDARDLTALDLGWRFGPDGSRLPPAGWPVATGDEKCEPRAVAA